MVLDANETCYSPPLCCAVRGCYILKISLAPLYMFRFSFILFIFVYVCSKYVENEKNKQNKKITKKKRGTRHVLMSSYTQQIADGTVYIDLYYMTCVICAFSFVVARTPVLFFVFCFLFFFKVQI